MTAVFSSQPLVLVLVHRHVAEQCQCMATSLNSEHVLALGWLPCALRIVMCEVQGVRKL